MKAQAHIVAVDKAPDRPWRYWGIMLLLASAGSWLAVIGLVRLLVALF